MYEVHLSRQSTSVLGDMVLVRKYAFIIIDSYTADQNTFLLANRCQHNSICKVHRIVA